VSVRQEEKRFPGGLEVGDELAVVGAEHVRVRTQLASPLENRRQPPVRVEGNATVFFVLGSLTRNANRVGVLRPSRVVSCRLRPTTNRSG
jgi:hypothetical protein